MWRVILLLLSFCLQVTKVICNADPMTAEGPATVTFELTEYFAIGAQRRDDGTLCDGNPSNVCEVFFSICGEAKGSGSCDTIYSEVFRTTGQAITTLPALVYHTTHIDKFNVDISIFDQDGSGMNYAQSMLLGSISLPLPLAVGGLFITATTSNTYHRLKFTLTTRCDENFYGMDCTKFCRPIDSEIEGQGHHSCSEDGDPVCLEGYEDASPTRACVNPIDQCSVANNKCFHGTCNQISGKITSSCICDAGWTGDLCETDIDECDLNPCVNGGICQQMAPPTFICMCDPAFEGFLCETTKNVCQLAENACMNGVCSIVSPGVTTCVCAPGYEGYDCEIDIDECAANPCQNGGTCTQLSPPIFFCSCKPGTTGPTCATFTNPCLSGPCTNGGVCVPGLFTDFTCICSPQFAGLVCEVNIDACLNRPCQNGGKCTDTRSGFVCCCTDGFTGDNCEGIREIVDLSVFLRAFTFIPLSYFRLVIRSRCPTLTFISEDEVLIESNADRNCFYGTFYDKARAAGRDVELKAERQIGRDNMRRIVVAHYTGHDAENVTSSHAAERS